MAFKFSLEDSFIYKVAAAANKITEAHVKAAQMAIKNVAQQAEAQARSMASHRLSATRQKYEDNISFREVGEHHYSVVLDGEAAYLVEGYPKFNLIEHGLARGPASRQSKDGYRYVVVPFEHKQAAARASHPDHNRTVQRGQITETTRGSLAEDLKYLKKVFGAEETVKLPSGSPAQGQVWSIRKSSEGPRWTYNDVLGQSKSLTLGGPDDRAIHHTLSGITKVQTQVGKGLRSAYLTWRTATENPMRRSKWDHPGFQGAHIFPDLEKWVNEQITQQLNEIFGGL